VIARARFLFEIVLDDEREPGTRAVLGVPLPPSKQNDSE
jgi:hypothetical protein